MKKGFLLIVVQCFLWSTATSAAQESTKADTLSLSLEQCIKIALDENPTIKVADMEITRVDYSKKELLGQLLPAVSFGGTYNRTLAKQVAYFNMGAIGGGGGGSSESSKAADEGIKMGLDNTFSVGFNASMPLIAPQLWKSLQLSDSQILQNVEAARASRISLVNQVENAYYTLLLSHDSYNVIQRQYKTAVYNAKIYKGRFELGTASEYEVLRTSVQVKNIEPQVLQAEIAIKQSLLQLKILMGIDSSVNIKTNSSLADYQSSMYDKAMNTNTALDENPDLRSLDLQTNYLKKTVEVQRMAYYPTLSLSASYNWNSSSDGSPFKNFRWSPYSVVGLTLSFPIFQGGQRYNKIKQAEISVREMTYQRENLERSLNMQIELQIDNITKNVKQVATNTEGVKEATKAFQIMEKSFDIGAATYLNLLDSELALVTSQLTYYQSIYNYLIAESGLKLLLGNANIDAYKTTE